MRRRALLGLLLLAACAQAPGAPAPESFRDQGVPIGSTTRGGLSDLAGEWVIAQSFPGADFAGPGTRLFVEAEGADRAVLRFAGPGGARDLAVGVATPGRLAPLSGEGPELWLLWVDDDFRTAVLGTPDGTLGWIMDRPGAASPDRTRAAREVLDWSGYDLARLVPAP